MPTLFWMDELKISDASMDSMHREWIDRCNDRVDAKDVDQKSVLIQFEEHSERHFALEQALMSANNYPASGCHLEEHRAVLKNVREVIHRLEQGDLPIVRSLVAELGRWFPEHTLEMDNALGGWLLEQRFGAVPVQFLMRPAALQARSPSETE